MSKARKGIVNALAGLAISVASFAGGCQWVQTKVKAKAPCVAKAVLSCILSEADSVTKPRPSSRPSKAYIGGSIARPSRSPNLGAFTALERSSKIVVACNRVRQGGCKHPDTPTLNHICCEEQSQ